MRLSKLKERYGYLKVEPFNLAETKNKVFMNNEDGFMAFIMLNEWVQRQLGLKNLMITNTFPDILANPRGSSSLLRIELEWKAENYKRHNHQYCDLIISYLRSQRTKTIKNIPVWSWYDCKNGFENEFILTKDIFNS